MQEPTSRFCGHAGVQEELDHLRPPVSVRPPGGGGVLWSGSAAQCPPGAAESRVTDPRRRAEGARTADTRRVRGNRWTAPGEVTKEKRNMKRAYHLQVRKK